MSNELFTKKIGIIGAGNIGRALIIKLLEKNYPAENIKLTYNGSIFTFEKLYDNNLVDMISDNSKIVKEVDVLILSLPPQSFKHLGDFGLTDDKLVISFMAGVPVESITKQTGSKNVVRIIPTGPDTILNSSAVAGVYGENVLAENIFKFLDIDYTIVEDEDKMDIIAVAGCLPAVYCKVDPNSDENKEAIRKISEDLPVFEEIASKCEKLVPSENKEEFIESFSTPGGVTECIIKSLDDGNSLYDSLLKGMEHTRKLV